jgi:hypothetical protein
MIADRSDAFRHNSCKKLAQLGKVIFTMSAAMRDRRTDLFQIQYKSDLSIIALVERHKESAESIAKALVQFRKGCVDASCREWGGLYKQVKLSLSNLYQNQNAKICALIIECQELGKSVQSLQLCGLQCAQTALGGANEFFKDVKGKARPQTAARRAIRVAVQPILERLEEAQARGEASFRLIRASHAQQIARRRGEITAFLKDELAKRRGPFLALYGQFAALEADVKGLRESQLELMRSRAEWVQQQKAKRAELMTETRALWRGLRKQIGAMKDQQKIAQKNAQSELGDLTRSRHLAKVHHKSQIDSVEQAIESQRRQRHKYEESHQREMQRREQDMEATEAAMTKQCKTEMKRRKDLHTTVSDKIDDCAADTNRLWQILGGILESSLERMTNRQIVFKGKIQQQETDEKLRLDEQYESMAKEGNNRLDVLEAAIEAQAAADAVSERIQTSGIAKLKGELTELAGRREKRLAEAREKHDDEVGRVRASCGTRLENKQGELDTAAERRREEKRKRIREMNANFEKDIAQKQAAADAQSETRLREFEASLRSESLFASETKAHEIGFNTTKAKLNFADRQIGQVREEHGKKVGVLTAEMSRLEKAKRQFERRRKTELQGIDENYETKIQVEQVRVRNAMDNLAKLYDADENQRGREIIEAVRKIRETNSHVEDYISRHLHELEVLRQDCMKTSARLRESIANLRGSVQERDLELRIADGQKAKTSALAAIESEMKARLDSLGHQLRQQTSSNQESLRDVEKATEIDLTDFKGRSEAIAKDAGDLAAAEASQLQKIESEFQQHREKVNRDHKAEMEKVNQRIVSAARQRDELLAKNNTEKESEKTKTRRELEQRRAENANSSRNAFTRVRAKSEDLSNTIGDLSKKVTDAELRMFDPPTRAGDQKRMDGLSAKIQSLDDIIEATFDTFVGTTKDCPVGSHDTIETPMPISSRNGRNTNNSTSRGSRRDSSRVVTPIESKLRKRTQFLITPQYD